MLLSPQIELPVLGIVENLEPFIDRFDIDRSDCVTLPQKIRH